MPRHWRRRGGFRRLRPPSVIANWRKDPGVRAWLYARQGDVTAARQVLNENSSSPISPFTAVAHYLLGEQEPGLAELDYLANDVWHIKTYFLRVDPLFDPMRNNPRFKAIVKKTGLLDN